MRTRDKPARVHGSRGGIQRSTKGERRSSRSSHHSNTVKNVEYTYRQYSLGGGPRSNMDSDSSEQQCEELTKCNSDHYKYYFKSYPFVFGHYHSPCQDSKKCASMPPKIQDRAYLSLDSLSPRTRSHRGKQGERRARGIEADPRRERSKK